MSLPPAAFSDVSAVTVPSLPGRADVRVQQVAGNAGADQRLDRPAAQLADAPVDVDDHAVVGNDDALAGGIDQLANALDAVLARLAVDQWQRPGRPAAPAR